MLKYALIGYQNTLAHNILDLLAARGVAASDVGIFAAKFTGRPKVSFGDNELEVQSLHDLKPEEFAAVIFTADENAAAQYAPKFAAAGAKVINATMALEGEAEIPMIVGGINDASLAAARKGIINVPQPPVVQLLGALAGLTTKYRIKSIRLTAFMAADTEGQDGMSELYNATRRILMNDTASSTGGLFHKTLAFNIIPQAGSFIGEETLAEWLYNSHGKQVLGDGVKIHANCAVVPAFVGIGQYVNVETFDEIDAAIAREDIKKAKGVLVVDRQEDGGCASLTDVQGESSIFVSRVRQDMTVENGISLWVAGDAGRIAAQNILALLKQFLKKDK